MRYWTQEQIDQLRQLREDGLSFGSIARIMNVTRNAAISKSTRMHLPVRMQIKQKSKLLSKLQPVIGSKLSPVIVSLCVHLRAAHAGQCRWPLWSDDISEKRFIVCGNACAAFSSYCTDHAAQSLSKGTYSERHAA